MNQPDLKEDGTEEAVFQPACTSIKVTLSEEKRCFVRRAESDYTLLFIIQRRWRRYDLTPPAGGAAVDPRYL